jgi:16S rRNA processing protein RimM
LNLLVPEETHFPSQKNQYYAFQLVGSSVITTEGRTIGKVEDIMPVKGNDLLVVGKGKDEILIPFAWDICREIMPEKKKIIIDPPEGLLEIDEI